MNRANVIRPSFWISSLISCSTAECQLRLLSRPKTPDGFAQVSPRHAPWRKGIIAIMCTQFALGKRQKLDLRDFMIWQDWEIPITEQFQS